MHIYFCVIVNIYIRLLSSVQTNEVHFAWMEYRWKHVLLRSVDLLFKKKKQIHHVIKFSFVFVLTDL